MKQEVILTISVMISKNKDTIQKCLDSVMPLLQSVPSELILVDTGCDQDTLELLKVYTENIVKFQWCNDFAKARNAGRKKAKGKWFLYLDDDEWFEDVSEFIRFFNGGEHKKYGYGMYYQRNYSNRSGTMFEDVAVYRLVRLEPDIQFIYPIHECFNRIPGEVKEFKAYVHHYGYLYETKAEKYAHSWRNIKPLLRELEKEPNNLKHVLQLSQEYNVIGEYEKSIEVSEKGIEEWKKGKAVHDFCLNSLYANIIDLYKQQYRHEDLYLAGKKFLELTFLDPLTRYLIEGNMAWACFEWKRYEECISYAKSYLTGYAKNKQTPGIFASVSTTVMNFNCFENLHVSVVLSCGIQAAVRCGLVELVREWFPYISWEEKVLITDSEMIGAIVRAAAVSGENIAGIYMQMCDIILSRKELEPFIIDLIEEIYEEAKQDSGLKWQGFADLNCRNWYFQLLKIRRGDFSTSEERSEIYHEIWMDTREVLQHSISYHIWNQMKKDTIDIGEILQGIPFFHWENAVTLLTGNMDMGTVHMLHKEIAEALSESGRHYSMWNIHKLQRAITGLVLGQEEYPDDPFSMLYSFKDAALNYYPEIYSQLVFRQNTDILPVPCQIALRIEVIGQGISEKKFGSALSLLKEIVELNPEYAAAAKMCSDWVGQQLEEEDNARRNEKNEFALLAISVKNKVRELIRQSKYSEARTILDQLEIMIPGDQEISMLKEKIDKLTHR